MSKKAHSILESPQAEGQWNNNILITTPVSLFERISTLSFNTRWKSTKRFYYCNNLTMFCSLPVRKPKMQPQMDMEEIHYGGEDPHWAVTPKKKKNNPVSLFQRISTLSFNTHCRSTKDSTIVIT